MSTQSTLGPFTWADPEAPFQLVDAVQVLPTASARDQIRAARALLADAHPGDRLAGALPFDLDEPGSIWVGTPVEYLVGVSPPPGDARMLPDEHRARFVADVEQALEQIASGEVAKVVLSRRREAESRRGFDPADVLARLSGDPASLAFRCDVTVGEAPAMLVGASPEILISLRGREFHSLPLAGSAARGVGGVEDEAVQRALRSSAKISHERAVVVEDIAARLSRLTDELEISEPSVLSTTSISHLATRLRGSLPVDSTLDSLDLVQLLHPTPAVCGTPRDAASLLIRRIEGRSRGLYTGTVGWQDRAGGGEWRVTLRSATLCGTRAFLNAGAGIVIDSVPEDELLETDVKFLAMRAALGTLPSEGSTGVV